MAVSMVAFTVVFFLVFVVMKADALQPNIVFIVADDLGWNDVSWNNDQMFTPNLEFLAKTGVILNQSYVQPVCTPSRVSFMSGYFPFRTGLRRVLGDLVPSGLPLRYPLLPERLKSVGYQTHMIGKWHLGYCSSEYLPTSRGFDSFLGYYTGEEDYYNRTKETKEKTVGFDFRINTTVGYQYNNIYSSQVFAREAERVLFSHSTTKPLFLYLAFQSVHAPLQVPVAYLSKCQNIQNDTRRTFCGMTVALDEAVGRVYKALRLSRLYKNTIIIFTTDNGGQIFFGGNNWPLRGNKNTLWEGGTRGVAFVHSPLLQTTPYVNNRMIHAVDWYPTILYLAGHESVPNLDGVNQWNTIKKNISSPRKEFVYNIDDKYGLSAAIRVGKYKLIIGDPGEPSGWFPPENLTNTEHMNPLEKEKNQANNTLEINLFNIEDDPTEHWNLAEFYPDVVSSLTARLYKYIKQAVPCINGPQDPAGDPKNFDGVFSPGWCQPIN